MIRRKLLLINDQLKQISWWEKRMEEESNKTVVWDPIRKPGRKYKNLKGPMGLAHQRKHLAQRILLLLRMLDQEACMAQYPLPAKFQMRRSKCLQVAGAQLCRNDTLS